MRPRAYAPYPSLIRAFTLINRCLTRFCLVLQVWLSCCNNVASVGPRVENFNIVRNDHGQAQMLIFSFRLKTPFLGKFRPKNQNCQYTLKLGTPTNSNMQNSMVLFTFSAFDQTPFLAKFGPKIQNCQFKLKFGTETNSIMHKSLVVFTASVFDRKYLFGANLLQNIKVARWS